VKGLHVRSLAEATPGREHAGGPAGVRRAYEEWVEDQHAWYGARTREAHAANRRFEFASKLLVGVAFLLAGVLLILGLCDTHLAYGWHAVMLVATFLALALAAALHAYERKRGYGALVRRYAPMRDLFAVAARRGRACIDAGDLSGARGVLQSLGVEVLAENTSWLSLHRDHPMEVHTG
jgi:uncharacterized membrane protein YphA (DoxX/SURF4 family)